MNLKHLNIFWIVWYWSVSQFKLYSVNPDKPNVTRRPDLRKAALREMDIKGSWNEFIYSKIMPVTKVTERSADYTIIRKKGSGFGKVQNTKVAKGGNYGKSDWVFDEDSYKCEKHGWEHDVTEEDIIQYDGVFKAMEVGTELVIDVVTRSREFEVAKLLTDKTKGFANYKLKTPVNDTDCDIITELGNAVEKMQYGEQRLRPNTLVISEPALRRSMRTKVVQNFFANSDNEQTLPGGRQAEALAKLIGVDRILVPIADMERDLDGKPEMKSIWPAATGLLLRTPPSSTMVNDRVLGWTRVWQKIHNQEYIIESYPSEENDCEVVRCKSYATANITCKDAILHIEDLIDLEYILNQEGLDLSSFND